ncbi:MAG: T9SS type A sorting domain-containing protein [candidate division KSB1 bacterium]|nr:T9SS type A sorting domain-containing protein [candidate division KSB1 bacterium]
MRRMNWCRFTVFMISVILLLNQQLHSQSKGGRWQFENNGFDTADWDTADDQGELQGAATYSSSEPLQEGAAYLWLDSTNKYDFFKIKDSKDLDFDNEDIGISAWIYPLILGDDVHWILNKGDQFPIIKTTNYSLRISKNKKLEFLIRDANNQAQSVASNFEIPINQWTFVAVFYDFSNHKVYMWNEVTSNPRDTLDFNQNFFSNNDPLAIGSWYASNPAAPSIKDFEGRIDDVRISGRLEDILPAPSAVAIHDDQPEVTMPKDIAIYPNPVSLSQGAEFVTFQFNSPQANFQTIQIFDVLGREVFRGSIPDQQAIFRWNLKDQAGGFLRAGVYFLRIKTDNKFYVKKFLVIN